MKPKLFGLLLVLMPGSASSLPAFPEAQGGGAASLGGRGGVLIEVTNLDDSGPGSLRACAEVASGARTCVFRVGGSIHLTSPIAIRNAYVTIAGQTAPGDGIQLESKGVNSILININTHDVVIRYLKARKGYSASCTYSMQNCGCNVVLYGMYNIVLDHLSLAWSQDDSLGMWPNPPSIRNVTVQYTLIAEGLITQSTGIITGSGSAETAELETDLDFHHNMMISMGHRGPFLGNKSTREVNDIVYNQNWASFQSEGGVQYDGINNIRKLGPMSEGPHWYEYTPLYSADGSGDATIGNASMYLSGNIGWHQPDPAGDQWAMVRETTGYNQNGTIPVTAACPSTDTHPCRRSSPLPAQEYPIIPEAVADLTNTLPPIVGASRRLACDGTWVPNRDSTDARIVNTYLDDDGITAIPANEDVVGGYPTLASGTPCDDSDHDGMPDVWENARGLNPHDEDDRNGIAANGYTNLENYLNGSSAVESRPAAPMNLHVR